MRIRQSSLASFQRCAQQVKLEEQYGEGDLLSATIFGTVVHYALMVMEQAHHEGRADARDYGIATFEHYWHPDNIAQLEPRAASVGITWLPRTTWAHYMDRGRRGLALYFDTTLLTDNATLLALEQPFNVPIEIDGRTHELTGTIDRLAIRWWNRKPILSVEDAKTGKKPTYLRFATQWTVYCYATTQLDFWAPFKDQEGVDVIERNLNKKGLSLMAGTPEGFEAIPRRGRWLSFRDGFAVSDAGWRTEADYRRLKLHLSNYIRAREADIFPLTVEGQVCMYCQFSRNGMCGGEPIPGIDEARKS
jgi:hypothetical protein